MYLYLYLFVLDCITLKRAREVTESSGEKQMRFEPMVR